VTAVATQARTRELKKQQQLRNKARGVSSSSELAHQQQHQTEAREEKENPNKATEVCTQSLDKRAEKQQPMNKGRKLANNKNSQDPGSRGRRKQRNKATKYKTRVPKTTIKMWKSDRR
jgi:hypothetical protein